MEITPLGDASLLVRIRGGLGDAPRETLEIVMELLERLNTSQIPGIIEWTPAYATVAAFYDPLCAIQAGAPPAAVFDWLSARIRQITVEGEGKGKHSSSESRLIEIPVCYMGDFAPDLEDISRQSGLSPAEVVLRHSAPEYAVHFLGFTPGFPYLSGLAPELATPRRSVPRKDTPAGSVGIGGSQTGIYPLRSPGGWNLIGRTPRWLFSADANPPALFEPGDRIRFRPITMEEFTAWTQ